MGGDIPSEAPPAKAGARVEGSLAVGDPAPLWTLPSGDGRTVTLSALRGRKVVLYFYPKDDTPGCTREACSFRDDQAKFTKVGAAILGVSCDRPASHTRFAEKFHLTFPLLSDADAAVCKAYGVYKQKSMYGRTYWGIERTTFLIDEQGRIAAIFPKVSVDGHSEAILQAIGAASGRAVQPPRGPAPSRAVRTPS